MLNWLYRRCAAHVVMQDRTELDARMTAIETNLKKLKTELATFEVDMSDKIYPTLRKMNQRDAVRRSREKEAEEDEEPEAFKSPFPIVRP